MPETYCKTNLPWRIKLLLPNEKTNIQKIIKADHLLIKDLSLGFEYSAHADLQIIASINSLSEDNHNNKLNCKQEFYLLNLLLKLNASQNEYIIRHIICFIFSFDESARIYSKLYPGKHIKDKGFI